MNTIDLKYFVYSRRSQDDKNRQVLSIEAQNRELKEFAEKEGIRIVGKFEESQSAFKPGRPVFKEMLDRLEASEANALLVWKADRLSRNALDGAKLIQALDDGVLQEIKTPYECFKREENRIMLYILFGMSNDFSRQISSNVKRGNRQKYERGEYIGLAPLGFLNTKIGNFKNIAPDPEKAPLVIKAFEEFSTGKYSLSKFCEVLDKDWGLKTRRGKKISKSNLHSILTTSAYYGIYKHGGELHEGSYQSLITKPLFDKVQEVLKNRSKPRSLTHKFAFTGLGKCKNCGAAITATEKFKHYKRTKRDAQYVYYHCSRRKGTCNEATLTVDEMENQLGNYLEKITIDEEVWRLGLKLLQEKHAEEIKLNSRLRKQWQQKFNSIQDDLDRLLKLRMREEITAEEYLTQKKTFLSEQTKVKERLRDNEEGSLTWLELAEKFFNTAYQAREMLNSDDLDDKRKAVTDVGWNLALKKKKIKFSFKQPFDVLLQPQYRTNVHGSQGSNLES